jgi:DNA helicase-2/ATP-dependent DNA helicase PcrA
MEKLRGLAARASVSLFEALALPDVAHVVPERTARAVRQFHAMITKYIGLQEGMSVSELTRALVDELGFLQAFKEENTTESLARRENIQELVSALSEFSDSHPGARLEDFLEEVALVSDVDEVEFGRNAVTLMTLHAAKGLEFPVVCITGLEEGLFPLSNSSLEQDELEEERRLMYVGITRAMQKLYLMHAMTRYRFGELSYSVKSRFLDELDSSVLHVENAGMRRPGGAYRRPAAGIPARPFTARTPYRRTPSDDATEHASDAMPRYEDESQEIVAAHIGARVMHESFGKGRIVAIDGRGDNARAVVEFESVGRKHLMLKFAHLRAY